MAIVNLSMCFDAVIVLILEPLMSGYSDFGVLIRTLFVREDLDIGLYITQAPKELSFINFKIY